jgi:hypothetical protein
MHALVRCELQIGRVTIIVHDPAAGVKETCFIVALPSIILFVSDPTGVGDVTRILCNAVPPDRGCQVNLTLKPVF